MMRRLQAFAIIVSVAFIAIKEINRRASDVEESTARSLIHVDDTIDQDISPSSSSSSLGSNSARDTCQNLVTMAQEQQETYQESAMTRYGFHPECTIQGTDEEHELGNRLTEIYYRRLFAAAVGISFEYKCLSRLGNGPTNSLLALLQVRESLEETTAPMKNDDNRVCNLASSLAIDMIRNDMNKVTAVENESSFLDDHHEDAVIYLSLGDNALTGRYDRGTGLLSHATYAKLLESAQEEKGPMQHISIITKASSSSFDRLYMSNKRRRATMIAQDLRVYLSNNFPNAIVEVHHMDGDDNGDDSDTDNGTNAGTFATTAVFARLIRAKKVAVCGPSSFCTWPVLGVSDQAIGYLYASKTHTPWVTEIQSDPRIRTYTAHRLANHFVSKSTDENVLDWLQSEGAFGNVCAEHLGSIRGCDGVSSKET